MKHLKAKAIFIGGVITVTSVAPSPEDKPMNQLDIFPIETNDRTIKESGGFEEEEFSKGQEIKVVTISWEE